MKIDFEDGTHVQISWKHERKIKRFVAKKGDEYYVATEYKKGGRTTCLLIGERGGDKRVITAYVKCSKKDNFSKKTGRVFSLAKVFSEDDSFFTHEQRETIWKKILNLKK